MTPERKRELRECNQDKYWDGARYSGTALTECLDEIDRLEARQQDHSSERIRLLAEIGSLRSQLAEQRGPQDIVFIALSEAPDDIEIRPWRTTGDVVRQRSTAAVVAWHRATGLAVVVDGGTYRENAGKAVLRLREALAECNAIWRKR